MKNARYLNLLALRQAGEIRLLETNLSFDLVINDVVVGTTKVDFKFYQEGLWHYENIRPMLAWKRRHLEAQCGIVVSTT